MSCRGMVLLLVPLLVSGAACGPERPANLLLVSLDTTRRDHCSVYGYARETTPTLERVGRDGAVFDQAYSPTASTGPTHASLFTSLYPLTHRVNRNGLALGEGFTTLAELLRARGYQTSAVVSSFVLAARFGFAQGFDAYDDAFVPAEASLQVSLWEGQLPPDEAFDRRASATSARAVAWLREARDPERPFFLFVHYFDAHDPYEPPPEFTLQLEVEPPENELGRGILQYDREIAFVDQQLGRLLDALAEAGLEDETLLVVTADHGEGLMEHGHMRHGLQIYEEAVRVPLLVRWPGTIPANRLLAEPVDVLDVAPTVLELLGHPEGAHGLRGRSLSGALRGAEQLDPARPIYLQRRQMASQVISGFAVRGEKFAVRAGRWKYISGPEEETEELFDLQDDPDEQHNLHDALPAKARELARLVETWRAEHRSDEPAAAAASQADRERLKALGYVD